MTNKFQAELPKERCWLVDRGPDSRPRGGVAPLPEEVCRPPDAVAPAEARVRVEAAGFNYKDALACAGHEGVARIMPLVPGIDAAGTLVDPAGPLAAGAPVVVTHNQMGESRHGGFATLLKMPVAAIVRRPDGLSARDAMALGTARLTALLACERLDAVVADGHAAPADAEWLVTGASGGVGMLAVAVAAIGMAGGHELATTVFPFILRGVTLCGIDAAALPSQEERAALWPRLAELWPLVRDHFPATPIGLVQVGDHAARMLRGESLGRAVVLPGVTTA